jgi:hypothetical protein
MRYLPIIALGSAILVAVLIVGARGGLGSVGGQGHVMNSDDRATADADPAFRAKVDAVLTNPLMPTNLCATLALVSDQAAFDRVKAEAEQWGAPATGYIAPEVEREFGAVYKQECARILKGSQ